MRDAVIQFYLGSLKSDMPVLHTSKALELLRDLGIGYRVSVFSAHRNPEQLEADCGALPNPSLYIAAAGMNAALPGALSALTNGTAPVLGVPLVSEYDPEAKAALSSMILMPPGRPVMVAGIGTIGFWQAALAAAQIIGLHMPGVFKTLAEYQATHTKPAQPGVEEWSPE